MLKLCLKLLDFGRFFVSLFTLELILQSVRVFERCNKIGICGLEDVSKLLRPNVCVRRI